MERERKGERDRDLPLRDRVRERGRERENEIVCFSLIYRERMRKRERAKGRKREVERRKGRGTTFFSQGDSSLYHFWVLLGHRPHNNAQKLLKQAVSDHLELFLGTYRYYCKFGLFSLILVDFFS
jgi:hypothetical protein